MKNLIKKWINVSGRSSRLEFFVITVITMTTFILITILFLKVFESLFVDHINSFYTRAYAESAINSVLLEFFMTGSVYDTANILFQDYKGGVIQYGIISAFVYILFLPFGIALITAAVRRLHDIGTFGWWVFIILVPVYLFFNNLILIVPLLFLFFKDGQPFHNKYGPDPKNPNTLTPLEIPKESERLARFEKNVLEIVKNIEKICPPYIKKIVEKIKQDWK
ncbi:DUF805 domain-containing protein [Ursidibacter arcticus]